MGLCSERGKSYFINWGDSGICDQGGTNIILLSRINTKGTSMPEIENISKNLYIYPLSHAVEIFIFCHHCATNYIYYQLY
ncbi:hypothetical protein CDL12_29667 [Handroanthus impetiginosus]|uniref:Uncharacterized protein n=1 Tax=Handroanthus impetiginosus TaxID=429701 RepID=A0A2G9FXS5_9LAMI|nr:hypothetical protein CDL12_29667 [Handroanthus impetiginosus]